MHDIDLNADGKEPLEPSGIPALSYKQIRENLNKPVPEELIREYDKTGGGVWLDYVNVTDLKDIMDARAGIWEVSIPSKCHHATLNEYHVIVRVTIHAKDRSITHEMNGIEKTPVRGPGDAFSNAFAMGFRRCLETHGLSRELWRKALQESKGEAERPSQKQQSSNNRSSEKPKDGEAKSMADLVTPKQLGMLRSMARERSLEADAIAQKHYKINADGLSKKAASWIIDQLKNVEIKQG
jgi:hypothetical protein